MTVVRNADTPCFAPHRGCGLAYSVVGEGPPVLFIQGTGLHGDGWLPQVEDLARDYTCLWFDNRGIGKSLPRGEAPITLEQMAEDARAVLDHAGLEAAHVVGHSLGGCIALELALSARARVKSLSLLCTAADGPGLVKLDGAMLWRGVRMQLGTRRSRRSAFLEMVLTAAEHGSVDTEVRARELEPFFGQDLAVRPPLAFKQIGAMKRWDASARLASLAGLPTLVVGAEHDLIARPPLVRSLADGISGARLVTLSDAAHGVPLTQPARINALLREHLGSVEPSRLAS